MFVALPTGGPASLPGGIRFVERILVAVALGRWTYGRRVSACSPLNEP